MGVDERRLKSQNEINFWAEFYSRGRIDSNARFLQPDGYTASGASKLEPCAPMVPVECKAAAALLPARWEDAVRGQGGGGGCGRAAA